MCIGSATLRSCPNRGQGHPWRWPFLSWILCILCKTAGRPHNTHKLMDCCYLPDHDRLSWTQSCMVMDDPEDLNADEQEPAALHVSIVQSPAFDTFYHKHPVQLTLDPWSTNSLSEWHEENMVIYTHNEQNSFRVTCCLTLFQYEIHSRIRTTSSFLRFLL